MGHLKGSAVTTWESVVMVCLRRHRHKWSCNVSCRCFEAAQSPTHCWPSLGSSETASGAALVVTRPWLPCVSSQQQQLCKHNSQHAGFQQASPVCRELLFCFSAASYSLSNEANKHLIHPQSQTEDCCRRLRCYICRHAVQRWLYLLYKMRYFTIVACLWDSWAR